MAYLSFFQFIINAITGKKNSKENRSHAAQVKAHDLAIGSL